MHHVDTLNLSFNKINDVATITALQYLPPQLRKLYLIGTHIDNVAAITALKHLPPHVHTLDLSWNSIDDVDKITALQYLPPQVDTLILEDNKINTPEKKLALVEVVKNNYHLTNVIVENPSRELTAQLEENKLAKTTIRDILVNTCRLPGNHRGIAGIIEGYLFKPDSFVARLAEDTTLKTKKKCIIL